MGKPKAVGLEKDLGPSPGATEDAAVEDGNRHYTESHARSFLKAMSWRASAFTVTAIIYFIWHGNWEGAGFFALADSAVKIILYYVHERAWNLSKLGRRVTTGKSIFLAWARSLGNPSRLGRRVTSGKTMFMAWARRFGTRSKVERGDG